MRDVPNGTGGLKENDKLDIKTESDVQEQPENDGTCDQNEILDGKPDMRDVPNGTGGLKENESDVRDLVEQPENDGTCDQKTQNSDVHKDLMEPKEIETQSDGESSGSYESYQLEIENCGKHSAEYSHDGSFEGFDASSLIPTLCTDDESADDGCNKSDGVTGKLDSEMALDVRDTVKKTVCDAMNEKESGETVAFPVDLSASKVSPENVTDALEAEDLLPKPPVVDLSASKVSPEFMRELKKTVRENVTDALEAEDLLPKPLPVVDLSASKVSPEFMAELKKTVRKNVTDALEAEDLLPKPLPVVENR